MPLDIIIRIDSAPQRLLRNKDDRLSYKSGEGVYPASPWLS